MTIMSYVAYPTEGKMQELINDLKSINGCEVEPADNKEIVVLVTASESKDDEKRIQKELSALTSLNCMTLVYAGEEEDIINQAQSN